MDRRIKIGLDIDTGNASEKLKEFEKETLLLEEKISGGLKLVPEEEFARTEEGINRLKGLLEELNSLALKSLPQYRISGINSASASKEFRSEEKEFGRHQEEMTGVEKRESAKRVGISERESLQKRENLSFLLDATGLFFGRQAEAYKAVSIAEATISAYNAANAALLPPPVGAGPILGEIQAGIVLMNSLKRVEKIASSKIPGYSAGGIVVGEKGPEVIENMQDYASGRAELIQRTILALQSSFNFSPAAQPELISEIKSLREDINKILGRPAVAYFDDREARKIYYSGNYSARKKR